MGFVQDYLQYLKQNQHGIQLLLFLPFESQFPLCHWMPTYLDPLQLLLNLSESSDQFFLSRSLGTELNQLFDQLGSVRKYFLRYFLYKKMPSIMWLKIELIIYFVSYIFY